MSDGIADGQWFTIQNRPDDPVRFEFDSNGVVTPGARPILFRSTSTVDQLAELHHLGDQPDGYRLDADQYPAAA